MDSTLGSTIRVHRRNLSPQSGKTLGAQPALNDFTPMLSLRFDPGQGTRGEQSLAGRVRNCASYVDPRLKSFSDWLPTERYLESPAGSGYRRGWFANYLPLN